MSVKTVINETYTLLNSIGVVNSKTEFYKDWLNRSEGYVRYLKHNNKQPSTDALAICSSKLKHYSKLLQQKNTTKMIELASVFTTYSTKLDLMICDNSTSKWMKQMNERTETTVH